MPSVCFHWIALVAQLDRASDFESEGREFESLRARQKNSHFLNLREILFLVMIDDDPNEAYELLVIFVGVSFGAGEEISQGRTEETSDCESWRVIDDGQRQTFLRSIDTAGTRVFGVTNRTLFPVSAAKWTSSGSRL
jgi:hypothetical protein